MNNSKVLTPPKNLAPGKPPEFQRFEDAIPAFFWDGKRYVLKNPVPYTVEEEDGYFTFE